MTNRITTSRARAFSLVELLTVIGILAIVIAIIIPALRHVRTAARIADTRTFLVQVGNQCSAFQADQRKLPGYFSPLQMANTQNATTYGFDAASNIMLDLLGGITNSPRAVPIPRDPKTAQVIEVGPGNALGSTMVRVDLRAMGGSTQSASGTISRGYLTMDQKRFVAQFGAGKRLAGNDHDLMPVAVDTFGSPVLAWQQDDNPSNDTFAAIGPPASGAGFAQFYWNSNAAFLDASVTSLGTMAQNQSYAVDGSVLAGNNAAVSRTRTMAALLGNPTAPVTSSPMPNPPVPLTPRAPIMFHSAGPDGIYVGKLDRGGRAGLVAYTPNQDPFGGGQFDDILQPAGH